MTGMKSMLGDRRRGHKVRKASSLGGYRAKRNFEKTTEPRGSAVRSGGSLFVVQKHAARRLHYDFRLELNGVLKSWAVARGPSLDPADRRLTVHVEDHPLEYGDFEGAIPAGEYGGGAVMVWDRGTWLPDGDPAEEYAKGRLRFSLEGKKLKGRWFLARMRGRGGEKRENWLLIKSDDEFARPGAGDSLLDEEPLSVVSGRSLDAIAADAAPVRKPRRRNPARTIPLRICAAVRSTRLIE